MKIVRSLNGYAIEEDGDITSIEFERLEDAELVLEVWRRTEQRPYHADRTYFVGEIAPATGAIRLSDDRDRARDFLTSHLANLHYWTYFVAKIKQAMATGNRQSIYKYAEILRNDTDYRDLSGNAYKVQAHFLPFYARLLMSEHPEWPRLFELRGTIR